MIIFKIYLIGSIILFIASCFIFSDIKFFGRFSPINDNIKKILNMIVIIIFSSIISIVWPALFSFFVFSQLSDMYSSERKKIKNLQEKREEKIKKILK